MNAVPPVHLVFAVPDAVMLRQAIEGDPAYEGQVLSLQDCYDVGPLASPGTEEERRLRTEWWAQVLGAGFDAQPGQDYPSRDSATVANLISSLDENAELSLWIWVAQNARDLCGYYWLISQLRAYQGRVFLLHLNNLPFFHEKGHLFYPTTISAILPRELRKAFRLARPVTQSEFELDTDEWTKLTGTGKAVRVTEGGKKLSARGVETWDAALLKALTGDWQKAGRITGQLLQKQSATLSESVLLWRLKVLAETGKCSLQGQMKGPRDFEVRLEAPAVQT